MCQGNTGCALAVGGGTSSGLGLGQREPRSRAWLQRLWLVCKWCPKPRSWCHLLPPPLRPLLRAGPRMERWEPRPTSPRLTRCHERSAEPAGRAPGASSLGNPACRLSAGGRAPPEPTTWEQRGFHSLRQKTTLPKCWWPLAQAEGLGVSCRAPWRAWRAEGEGRAASGFRASLHPTRGEESTGKGTRRHLWVFFFFAFIMKTKQMPQEKGP